MRKDGRVADPVPRDRPTHTAARAQLLIVDFRHTLLDVIESEHMGGYVSSPAALGAKLSSLVDLLQARMPAPDVSQAQLRARSWWSGPDIYVVVDDYDLVAVSSGNPLMVLLEYLPHARDLGLHLVVARRSGVLLGRCSSRCLPACVTWAAGHC